jgi:hypothetical protein
VERADLMVEVAKALNKEKISNKGETVLRLLSHSLLVGGYAFLMLDIRYEHREAVGDEPTAWIPIVFSAVMIVLIPLAIALWRKVGKRLAAVGYGASVIVGLLGSFFHAHGHFLRHLQATMAVWQTYSTKIVPHSQFAPFFAPLAFIGLGSIGLLFIFADDLRKKIERSA